MAHNYSIELLGKDGRWVILGSDRLSGRAQNYMRDYQRLFPRYALRVVENPSRRLIVCHDPLTDDERATVSAA